MMSQNRKETLEERDTRRGGENELRGSKDAQRALAPKIPRKDSRKTKR
jgi:hypothetical protein